MLSLNRVNHGKMALMRALMANSGDECLSAEWFRSRLEAKVVIEDWRIHYNNVRPHSSLNYQTPSEFIGKLNNNLITKAGVSM